MKFPTKFMGVSEDRPVCVENFVFSFLWHSSQVSESVGRSFDRGKDSWILGDWDRTLGKLPLDFSVSNTQPFHVLKAGQLLLL